MGVQESVEMLLAEDDPSDVEFILRALKKNDLNDRVHVVSDGSQALDFLFCTGVYSDRSIKNLPKVILLDLKLPKVNGKEVLKRIKSDERTKTVPVVIMTSSQEENDMIESYKLGANGYVAKPVDFEKFAETVKQIGLYWLRVNKTAVV